MFLASDDKASRNIFIPPKFAQQSPSIKAAIHEASLDFIYRPAKMLAAQP